MTDRNPRNDVHGFLTGTSARRALTSARMRGLTLVELLVAMVIGLFLILGMGSIFLMNQQTYRTSGALANVADGSRIAFELMARDIRAAGATGCDSTSGHVGDQLGNQGTAWWADWGNALHGYGHGQVDLATATGTGLGERVDNTDSLEVIRSVPDTSAAQAGDLVVVCRPGDRPITSIVAYNPTAPNTVSVSKLAASDWYIGNNPVGGRSLYRNTLVSNPTGGGMVTAAQEMVRDVTDMEITYLQVPNKAFVDATDVTDWTAVTAARIVLTIESTSKNASVNASQPIIRTYSATVTVRSRVI